MSDKKTIDIVGARGRAGERPEQERRAGRLGEARMAEPSRHCGPPYESMHA